MFAVHYPILLKDTFFVSADVKNENISDRSPRWSHQIENENILKVRIW